MSLLSSASVWNNDDASSTRKRLPTMARKTAKKMPDLSEPATYVSEEANYKETTVYNIEDTQTIQEDRNKKVNDMLNKITSVNVENDGNSLKNFVPLDGPKMSNGLETGENANSSQWANLLMPNMGKSDYSANNLNIAKLSNYKTSYDTPPQLTQSYYSKMGLGAGGINDNKMMEKINYMIHLLEQQHDEKTSNVTEEFILYTFLGVFIIFIVDSFSRTGKYTR